MSTFRAYSSHRHWIPWNYLIAPRKVFNVSLPLPYCAFTSSDLSVMTFWGFRCNIAFIETRVLYLADQGRVHVLVLISERSIGILYQDTNYSREILQSESSEHYLRDVSWVFAWTKETWRWTFYSAPIAMLLRKRKLEVTSACKWAQWKTETTQL